MRPTSETLVSIPIGFSSELQRRTGSSCTPTPTWFQSLLGFPVSCNQAACEEEERQDNVSIPIGFSSELQHARGDGRRDPSTVSIPIGFSSELQPRTSRRPRNTRRFQSLLGFPVSCNRRRRMTHQTDEIGFNPYWVFQ